MALNLHRIDKDVQRCDRNYYYFTTANLEKLRNIMCRYKTSQHTLMCMLAVEYCSFLKLCYSHKYNSHRTGIDRLFKMSCCQLIFLKIVSMVMNVDGGQQASVSQSGGDNTIM